VDREYSEQNVVAAQLPAGHHLRDLGGHMDFSRLRARKANSLNSNVSFAANTATIQLIANGQTPRPLR
jgi:hypothetical protein